MTVEGMTDRSAPVVVEHADRGRGFVLASPERADARAGALQAVAGMLLRQTVWQPPVDTGPFPVLNLLRVAVPERSEHWCFALQGRGGPFGTAGTCRFVFADSQDWSPGEVWDWGVRHVVSPLFRADADPSDPWPLPADAAAQITGVLRGLATGRSRIHVGNDPNTATGLLSRLLPVLPPALVGRYLWSTCLLKQPYSAQQPAVAGSWPQQLRAANPGSADGVTAWFDDRASLPAASLAVRDETALRWLAVDLAAPRPTFRPGAVPVDLAALLEQVAAHQPVGVSEVASQLGSPVGLERLARAPDTVTQWARREPDLARRHLMTTAPGMAAVAVEEALFAGLWIDQLCFPPTPEPLVGWHERLAALIHSRYRTRPEGIVELVGELRRPGMPLATEVALRGAGPWLTLLGLDRRDHPELFPFSMAGIAERLRSERLSAQDRADLLGPEGRLRSDLRELVPAAVHGGIGAVVDLLDLQVAGVPPERMLADVGDLAGELVAAYPTPEWLADVVAAASAQAVDVQREVVRHGLRSLVAAQPHADVPHEALRGYAATLAGPGTDPEVCFLLDRLRYSAAPVTVRPGGEPDHDALAKENVPRELALVPPAAPMPREQGGRRRDRPSTSTGPDPGGGARPATRVAATPPVLAGLRASWSAMLPAVVAAVVVLVAAVLWIRVMSDGASPAPGPTAPAPTVVNPAPPATFPAPTDPPASTTRPPTGTTARETTATPTAQQPPTTKKVAQGGSVSVDR